LSKKLFISKPIIEVQELVEFCKENDFELVAHSFLSFKAIPFDFPVETDVVFFGSKRGVEYFIDQQSIPENIEVACVGNGTANYIKSKGYNPSFIGEKSGKIDSVAEDFKTWLGDRKVVFAQAKDSNRSFSSVINSSNSTEISVYETIINSATIVESDIYVFTSPSNVDGFLLENSISEYSIIIAWGDTTEKHLIKNGFTVRKKLKNSSISELLEVLHCLR
jgi:uroporphyrinogen-III synthase